MEVTKHPLVPVWDDCEDVALLSSLQFKALRKRFHLHKQRLDKVQSTLHVQRMVQEVDELHAKAQNFRLTRLRRSEEAADKLKRENMRMVGKLHTVIRDAEVRHKQLSTLSRPSTPSQGSLNISVRKQRYDQIKRENAEMVDRLRTAGPAIATAHELADRYHAHRALLSRRKRFRRQNVVRLGLPPPELQQEQVPRPPGETPSYMRPRLPPVKVEEEPPPTKPKPKPKPRAQQAAPVARAESSNEATPGEQQEAQMDERVSEQAASAPAAKGTAGAAEDPQPEGKVDGPADGDDSQQEYGEDFEEYASPAVSPTSKAATQARSKEGSTVTKKIHIDHHNALQGALMSGLRGLRGPWLAACIIVGIISTLPSVELQEVAVDVPPDGHCQADDPASCKADRNVSWDEGVLPHHDAPRRLVPLEEYSPKAAEAKAQLRVNRICCVLAATLGIYWSYRTNMHPGPKGTERPPFWKYFLAVPIFGKFFRSPWDTPFTHNDFPQGPHKHDMEKFADRIDEQLAQGRSLEGIFWRDYLWACAEIHVFQAINRRLILWNEVTFSSAFLLWFELSPEYWPNFAMDVALGNFLGWMSSLVLVGIEENRLLRFQTPFVSGIFFCLARRIQGCDLATAVQTNASEVAGLAAQVGELGGVIFHCTCKSVVTDFATMLVALWKLYNGLGPLSTVAGLAFISLGGAISSKAVSLAVGLESQKVQLHVQRREYIDFIANNLKVIRQTNWVDRAMEPLVSMVQKMRELVLHSIFWSGFAGGASAQMDSFVTAILYILVVFFRSEHMTAAEASQNCVWLGFAMTSASQIIKIHPTLSMLRMKFQMLDGVLKLPTARQDLPKGVVKMANASFEWPVKGADRIPVLHELDFAPAKGELVLICGANGSGKSSFLLSLTGELPQTGGELTVPSGVIGWQPQVPNLLEGTIDENVRFNVSAEDGNSEFVMKALYAVGLLRDMVDPTSTLSVKRQFTEVGVNGSELSGGQRARTMLARACYQALTGAETMLLDDPVAQVDNTMMIDVWEKAVLGVMKGCTRIVAVNSQLLQRLAPSADRLVVLKGGRAVYNGPVAQAQEAAALINDALGGEYDFTAGQLEAAAVARADSGSQFEELLRTFTSTAAPPQEAGEDDSVVGLVKLVRESTTMQELLWKDAKDSGASTGQADEKAICLPKQEWQQLRSLLQKLERQHGSDDKKNKVDIFKVLLANWKDFALMPVISLLMGIVSCKTGVLLGVCREWSLNTEYNLFYQAQLLGGSCAFFAAWVLQELMVAKLNAGVVTSSMTRLHNTLRKIGQHYFWWQPQEGMEELQWIRVLDVQKFTELVSVPVMVVASLSYMLYTTTKAGPLLTFALLAQLPFFYKIAHLGHWHSQVMLAMETSVYQAVSRLSSLFDNAVTVRAGKAQVYTRSKLHNYFHSIFYAMYWNNLVLLTKTFLEQTTGSLTAIATVTIMRQMKLEGADPVSLNLLLYANKGLGSSLFGLCQAIPGFFTALALFRRFTLFVETDLVEDTGGKAAPAAWPDTGKIVFEDITFRYRPHSSPALRGVSFTIEPAQKLGIVGAPGSGKSTLVGLLTRLSPLQNVAPFSGGRILIDGVDISTLRLTDLRAIIGIVPQDCLLFPGTLKENVGVEFTDAEVLVALEHIGLDARRLSQKENLAEALATPMTSIGLSGGERQLLVAARALVKRPKVLILDECTASLSREQADSLLDTILLHSKEMTVLSIAHRLRFVLKSEKILVLGGGTILAHGTVADLLQDEEGYFAKNLRLEQQEDGGS